MKRKNLTRNALFTSIISLLLCVSMLVGTTFAWFTDSVTSGVNTIAAGNLDVELSHSDKNDSGYVSQETKLFNDITLWEPGVVVYENFTVENVGNLALLYKLSINFVNETKVTTADGVEHGLSEVLKVALVEDGFKGDRAEAQNLAFDKSLSTFSIDGYLEGNTTSKTYGVVIYWAPNSNEIDNLFNMNNGNRGKTLSIDLGINLVATQEVYEDDSFGDDYDEGLILPDVSGDVLVEDNGIQYYYNENGDYVLYLVTEAFTDTTLTIPEGVDAIGNYAFAYNSNVENVVLPTTVRDLGRGFDSSSVKKVVLNEGLETISSRAFRSTPSLEEVVIPSTVTVIEDNAFQKSGIKNITIPATVKTIGETAFGSSQIETVTFEGNTSIQGYAFRGCSKLRTVNMNGDDVTFIASTLNNRNSTWFCNGESNNPNTSNITFNVVNETVATRVKTAMGAEAGNTPVYINGELFNYTNVKNDNQLKAALAQDENVVLSNNITFTGVKQMPDRNNYVEVYGNKTGFAQYGGVLDGNGFELIDSEGDKSYVVVTHGGTIKNLTIKSGARGIVTYSPTEDVYIDNVVVDGAGYALNSTEHSAVNMVVTNSTINGWTSLAGFKSVSFNNCKLGENSLKYWQKMGYGQDYDRLFRVYSPTTYTRCEFEQGYYLDLSSGGTATLIDCTVNGVEITAENYAQYITIELPTGGNLADCVNFK